jgi:bis(5'-nucleosyl)-tetraphosphatase (symmetrical)
VRKALELGAEVEAALRGRAYREFLENMYGSQPDQWSDTLKDWDRLRVIVNAMTRMRFSTPDGKMDFKAKGARAPKGYRPWFELRPKQEQTLVCGHWSALGLKVTARLAALDSGCVWGGKLSAMRLEDRKLYAVPCRRYQEAGGE